MKLGYCLVLGVISLIMSYNHKLGLLIMINQMLDRNRLHCLVLLMESTYMTTQIYNIFSVANYLINQTCLL